MTRQNRIWMWLSAVVMMLVGFFIALKGNSAGWFLVFMGIVYISIPLRRGQTMSANVPGRERWVFLGIAGLSLLVVALLAIFVA